MNFRGFLYIALILGALSCTKDLALYPTLKTDILVLPPDSAQLKTHINSLEASTNVREAGCIWSYSLPSPTITKGYDGIVHTELVAPFDYFDCAVGGLPLNMPVYFRTYLLLDESDTIYGNVVRAYTGQVEISSGLAVENGAASIVSAVSGLTDFNAIVQYGHIWAPASLAAPLQISTATGRTQYEHLVQAQFGEIVRQIEPGVDYHIRAYVVHKNDTLYGNILATRLGNVWQQVSDFPGTARWGAVAFTLGDRAFVGTGEALLAAPYTKNKGLVKKDFWMYDPVSDSWTEVAPFPGAARYNAVAFVVDGKAYVGTGRNHSNTFQDFYQYTPPPVNQWVRVADYPITIMGAASFAVNGRGYVSTGAECGTAFLPAYAPLPVCDKFESRTFEYRPDEDKWYQMADFPPGVLPRFFAVGFSIASTGYVGTGLVVDPATSNGYFTFECYAFDPFNGGKGLWTRVADLGIPSGGPPRLGAVGFAVDNYGYIGTGSTYNYPSYQDFWRYDPVDNHWVMKANVGNLNREFATAFTIHGQAYVGLGILKGPTDFPTKNFWKYTPEPN